MEEGYGASLLRRPDLIEDLVKTARAVVPRWRVVKAANGEGVEERRVPFSVSIKIRLVPFSSRAIGGESSSFASLSGSSVSQ